MIPPSPPGAPVPPSPTVERPADQLSDVIAAATSSVLDAHMPVDDWRCQCGADLFGGSAAYSWLLFKSHFSNLVTIAVADAS